MKQSTWLHLPIFAFNSTKTVVSYSIHYSVEYSGEIKRDQSFKINLLITVAGAALASHQTSRLPWPQNGQAPLNDRHLNGA